MASKQGSYIPVSGAATGTVAGAGRGGTGEYEEPLSQENSLKAPLLKQGQARAEEESRVRHTWVYVMTFFAVLGNVALGFGLGFTSPTQAAMVEDLDLTTSQFSTFGSLITVGAMAGAIISGRAADYFGRRGGLIVCCLPSIAGYVLVAFGKSTIPLYIGRFAIGLAGGVVCFIVPILVAEAAPRHLRGFLGAMQQCSMSIGIMVSYLVGWFVSWRTLALVGTLPSIVSIIGLVVFVHESPYWLAKKERAEALKSSLQNLRGKDYDVSREFREIQGAAESAKLTPPSKLSDLLQRRYARPLFVGCGVHMFQQITGINGVMLYAGAIFLAAGVGSANAAALSIAVLQVIMTFVSAGLVEKAGRRFLILLSTAGMAISLFFVGLSFYLRGMESEAFHTAKMGVFIDILALASLLVYDASFAVGIGPMAWVLMGEIFPDNVKANAGSIASLVNWFSGWAVSMSFNFLLEWSAAGAFWLFAVISLVAVIFTALFVPETQGKTLQEIEQSFK